MLIDKPFRLKSEKHRRWVASLPCLRCWTSPCQAAHVTIGRFGFGMKTGDNNCVPLCPIHHVEFDKNQRRVSTEWGVDIQAAANDYWSRSPHYKEKE